MFDGIQRGYGSVTGETQTTLTVHGVRICVGYGTVSSSLHPLHSPYVGWTFPHPASAPTHPSGP